MKTFWDLRDDLQEVGLGWCHIETFKGLKETTLLCTGAFDSPAIGLKRRFNIVQDLFTDLWVEFVEEDNLSRLK